MDCNVFLLPAITWSSLCRETTVAWIAGLGTRSGPPPAMALYFACSAQHGTEVLEWRWVPTWMFYCPFPECAFSSSVSLFLPQISKVRSLTLDHWSHEQVLSMLEGGNHQLFNFFQRHFLTGCKSRQSSRSSAEPLQTYRYRTKAARFYRENLGLHAARVASSSVYRGREASRKSASSSSRAVAVNQANTNNSSNS